ncbi:EFR1 family ferrodoxin [Sedimentibacter sp.]|uniref:EFR1 family ferrodoxin n=1 Tax=Sedimentibacter sp. TaxID=1960295 RepID=UPI000EDFA243|nr:EFR1 family ferrodoxin [Sedimentibacter sp.]HCX62059.1 (4Fe-4S)-binding protein [Clostridiales bacterium]
MIGNLSLLYFSATDTTKKVIKSIAKGFNEDAKEYDITLPENRMNSLNFKENEIIIIGVPVYAGRVPEFLSEYFLKKIFGNNTYAVFIVVYGNRAYDDALLELKGIFENNGFIGVAGGAFIGEHSYTERLATGRPDDGDLNIAYKFGKDISEKINNIGTFTQKLKVKGNYPYRKGMVYEPVMIDTNESCINCGICSMHCPMGAIDKYDNKSIDIFKCIRCCSCIKRCPVNAKDINYDPHKKFLIEFISKYSTVRQEPELFSTY